MKIIENITPDEIRVNINRQANNTYDQVATFEALYALQESGQISDVVTSGAISKMRMVLKRQDKILEAVKDKINLFERIVDEYDAKPELVDVTEDWDVSDTKSETPAETVTQ